MRVVPTEKLVARSTSRPTIKELTYEMFLLELDI
jgi:hypothetical protein